MAVADTASDWIRALHRTAAADFAGSGVGVVRSDGPDHLELQYVDCLGATAYRVPFDQTPEASGPRPADVRHLSAEDLERNAARLVESRVLNASLPEHVRGPRPIRQVFTLPLHDPDEEMLLIVALADNDPPLPARISAIEALAARAADDPAAPPSDEIGLLRRPRSCRTAVAGVFPCARRSRDL